MLHIRHHLIVRFLAYHQAQLTIADYSKFICSVASRHMISSPSFPKNLTPILNGAPNQVERNVTASSGTLKSSGRSMPVPSIPNFPGFKGKLQSMPGPRLQSGTTSFNFSKMSFWMSYVHDPTSMSIGRSIPNYIQSIRKGNIDCLPVSNNSRDVILIHVGVILTYRFEN